MAKNTVLIYTEWLETLNELTMEERGILLTAILNYQSGLELPEMNKMLKLIFIPIRQSIDRDNTAYIAKCEKNRENGKLGGAPKGNQNAKKTTETTERLKKQPKQPDNDNENDNDYVNDNDKDKDNDKDNDNESGSGSGIGEAACAAEPPQPPRSEADHAQDDQKRIIYEWNAQRCTQDIRGLIGRRKQNLAACGTTAEVLEVIRSLDQQSYLVQQANDGKPVTFDWFIQPDNFQKVAEGNYSETYGGEASDGKLKRNW